MQQINYTPRIRPNWEG